MDMPKAILTMAIFITIDERLSFDREKISLSDIANAGGTCKTSCCTIFKKFTNQTPNEYLTDYRLHKSIDLMQNTDMTLTEICYDVGFSGASYFSETFRKVYDMSPTEYKKMASN